MDEREWLSTKNIFNMMQYYLFGGGYIGKVGDGVTELNRKLSLFVSNCCDIYGKRVPISNYYAAAAINWSSISSKGGFLLNIGTRKKILDQRADILRDIAGNIFKPMPGICPDNHYPIDPESCYECKRIMNWEGGIIPNIAREIDFTKDFTGMMILSDALSDVGCTNQEIFNHIWDTCPHPFCASQRKTPRGCSHCKNSGRVLRNHYRGCWLLDGILTQKELAIGGYHEKE